MLNVTIQNDGKIEIQTECSDVKEMRSNINLLLAIVSSMETEGQTDREADRTSRNPSYQTLLKLKNASAELPKIKTTKNECKIVRKAGKSKSWSINSDSHNNNVIVIDFKV